MHITMHINMFVGFPEVTPSEPERFPGVRFGVSALRFGRVGRFPRQTGRRRGRDQGRLHPVPKTQ